MLINDSGNNSSLNENEKKMKKINRCLSILSTLIYLVSYAVMAMEWNKEMCMLIYVRKYFHGHARTCFKATVTLSSRSSISFRFFFFPSRSPCRSRSPISFPFYICTYTGLSTENKSLPSVLRRMFKEHFKIQHRKRHRMFPSHCCCSLCNCCYCFSSSSSCCCCCCCCCCCYFSCCWMACLYIISYARCLDAT